MNIEWFIFKRRFLWKFHMILGRGIATCKAKWFLFHFWLKYHKLSYDRQGEILERWMRMGKHRQSKKESFDRCLARMIAETGDRLGVKQYEIREVMDRIFEK